jgi:hypothetical protein
MSTKVNAAARQGVRARSVWVASLLFGLAAMGFLYGAPSSQALGLNALPGADLSESPDEPFEELEEAGACETLELEAEEAEVAFGEECDAFEEDEEAAAAPPPSECLLRTISARVFAQTNRERVNLVLGYTSFVPANVTIDYRLRGGKGALSFGRTTHHFSRQGVFRVTEKLNELQMAKVIAARDFSVRIRIPSTPGYCRSYFTRHLNVKRKAHDQVVWYQAR